MKQSTSNLFTDWRFIWLTMLVLIAADIIVTVVTISKSAIAVLLLGGLLIGLGLIFVGVVYDKKHSRRLRSVDELIDKAQEFRAKALEAQHRGNGEAAEHFLCEAESCLDQADALLNEH